MKADGMDAVYTSVNRYSDYSTKKVEATTDTAVQVTESASVATTDAQNPQQPLSVAHLTNFEKRELPISEKVVIDAIERANKAILGANTRFEFAIHDKTKEIMVKIINADTNEVIREIPPEKTLDMVAKMWEMAGIMIDERR